MARKKLTGAGAVSSQVALARFFDVSRQHVREVNAAVRLDPEGPWPWEHIWAVFGFAPETDREIEELQEPLLRPKAIQHATGYNARELRGFAADPRSRPANFPHAIRLTQRVTRYRASELRAYLAGEPLPTYPRLNPRRPHRSTAPKTVSKSLANSPNSAGGNDILAAIASNNAPPVEEERK